MKTKVIGILKKELREVFRDKKSLAMMFIIPVMIPLLVIGMSALFESQVTQDSSVYNKIGFTYEIDSIEEALIENMEIEAVYGDVQEIQEKFDAGEIYLYITKEDNRYIMNYDAESESGSYASLVAEEYLNFYKQALQEQILTQDGYVASDILNIITIEENVVGQDNFYASYIVGYAFLFILMAITVSATYPATDTTAGEKERGTMETLLTFPIKSRDIILGKLLSVTMTSIITGLLSLVLAILSFSFANDMFTIYATTPISISFISIMMTVVIIIIYSLFISGLCIAVASMSKTFKEAQSALTPLTFISFFPGMIAFMIEVDTTAFLSIVPFLNYSLILNDVSNGIVNYLNIFLMIVSTLVYISIVIWYIIRQYNDEKVLFSN